MLVEAIVIGIDVIVFIVLLAGITGDDDIPLGTAFVIAVIGALGTGAAGDFAASGGIAGIAVAIVLIAALIAIVVSALLGVEIKRAALVAVVFTLIHFGAVGVLGRLMHRA